MVITKIKNQKDIPFLQSITSPIDALIARGFLFEPVEDNLYKYYFDIEHSRYMEGDRTDYDDLVDICGSTGIGNFDVQTGILTIENDNVDLVPVLFTKDRRSFPVCESDQGFEYYLLHSWEFNPVGVIELEPFVARYIKALHACNIRTDFCCDDYGFHNTKSKMDQKEHIVIKATGLLWKCWHKWVVENFISQEVALPWNNDCTEVVFEGEHIADIYENLQLAASILFAKRQEIISLYDSAILSDELDFLDDIEAVKQMMIIASKLKENKEA